MKLSENIKPISYLKANAAEVIEKLKTDHQPLVITQNGEAAMVVQSVADYERTQETLALLEMAAQASRVWRKVKRFPAKRLLPVCGNDAAWHEIPVLLTENLPNPVY